MGSVIKEKVVKFPEEVVVADKEVKEVTLRRALVRDRLEAQELAGPGATPGKQEVYLIGLLCDIPYEDLMEISDGCYELLTETYYFLKGSPRQADKKAEESKPSDGQS
ncbi:phage tail assembly protein [Maridesulfovibrio sp.]|uniref:phage tail assembly protein n=1 Tax=Maridesulfovibrio sp. TaxID=2795000 RepID=UPI003B00BC56